MLNELSKNLNELKKSGVKISIIKGCQKVNDRETQQLIINDFHLLPTGGHAGVNRMFNNVKKYYSWPKMKTDIANFIKKCDDCQRCKYSNPRKEPMSITTTATSAMEKVILDLVGPLDQDLDNNRYVLTIQCELSKFVEAYPIENKETVTVAKAFVNNFILRYGIPKEVVTDQGTEFLSSVFKNSCKLLKVKQLNSTAYHHQTLGALENSHKHLGAYLRIYATEYPNHWSSWVPYWCFAYNTSVHTKTKYSPFELVFGKSCRLPSNLTNEVEPVYNFDDYPNELKFRLQRACSDARENLVKSKSKRKHKYYTRSNPIKYKRGDKILVRNSAGSKTDPLFKGPFEVLELKDPNVVIRVDKRTVEVHKDRIKLYRD